MKPVSHDTSIVDTFNLRIEIRDLNVTIKEIIKYFNQEPEKCGEKLDLFNYSGMVFDGSDEMPVIIKVGSDQKDLHRVLSEAIWHYMDEKLREL